MGEFASGVDRAISTLPPFLMRGGDLGERIAAHDWQSTPLGPLSGWPSFLKSTIGFMLSANVPLALLWGPDGILLYNQGYAVLSGSRHPTSLGTRVLESWPEIASVNAEMLEAGLAGRSLSYSDTHLVLYRNGPAEDVWVDLNSSPIFDDAGSATGVMAMMVETTRRHQAEVECLRSRERLDFALRAAGVIGLWDWNVGSDRIHVDSGVAGEFGVDSTRGREGLSRAEFMAAVHPEDRERVEQALNETASAGVDLDLEYRIIGERSALRWVASRGAAFRDRSGKTVRLSGALIDITGLKNSEETRRLLVRELHHRVKNTFAVIGGMVTMTARSTGSVQEMASALRGRLVALAGAHDLFRPAITAEMDQTEQTTLADLFAAVLLPHQHHPDQFRLETPPVEVGVTAAASLALVLHELATNAVKYGSLSTPMGRLHVTGRLTETELILDWLEEGGPAISGPPQHLGFGSRLAGMSVSGQLGGSIEFHWKESGLQAILSVSRERLKR